MKRVAIIGLGLMGASLGLALKERGTAATVVGYARRAATRMAALERGCVDEIHAELGNAVADSDLIVYCTPILTISELVSESLPHLKPGAILTDVGSTKADLTREVEACLAGHESVFVGSHPVAGSEQQGLDAARADLYRGAVVIVTPPVTQAPADAVDQVCAFWAGVEAVVDVMPAATHDQLMARTSHLPHLVASALALTVGRDGAGAAVGRFCGAGFQDTSRVADGSPDVWHDIVYTNRAAIAAELEAYRTQFDRLCDRIAVGDFEALRACLAEGRIARRALLAHPSRKHES